ncbi:malonate decarboxylase subunit epsilon [Celerinatantimonas yamalensis]|uniref:Malonyl CoA-acyl carrier protein transacylase n=1 Tax=Celerinatantimonas yamalensis TaxID=559956 RepID=A0ABW9G556_9GAMM
MKVLFTFPGQGPQYPGMLHQLPEATETQALLAHASKVLGEDVLRLDNEQALASTRAVQLCLLISGVAYSQQLRNADIIPDMSCGLSIGAFAAAVVCGALDFDDALRLVAKRGELMQHAYPSGYGLTAIKGLFQPQVEHIVADIQQQGLPLYLANINGEQQLVVAGREDAMQLAIEQASLQGGGGQQLAVSVPSHCELLKQPAKELFALIEQVSFKRPYCAYLSGSSGRVLWQPQAIADDLAFNMARQVKWYDAMVSAYQRDVRLAIECPPGSVLTRLTKPLMPAGEALSMSQTALETIQMLVQRTLQSR